MGFKKKINKCHLKWASIRNLAATPKSAAEMSTSGEGRIDLNKLERELVGALQADRKYSRENDAKFRAVSQRVATYEEFRQVV